MNCEPRKYVEKNIYIPKHKPGKENKVQTYKSSWIIIFFPTDNLFLFYWASSKGFLFYQDSLMLLLQW